MLQGYDLFMLIVLVLGVVLVLELFGVRFLSPWIESLFEAGAPE